jgi:excisionase family DNA binding protein
MANASDELMTATDAGHILGLSADMVRTLHRCGRLPALLTTRGHRLFRRADVERLAKERAKERTASAPDGKHERQR